MWHKLVKLAAACSAAGAFLLPNQPHYTGNETGAGALFQYLNTLAPLKAPRWGRSTNSYSTSHYSLLARVPSSFYFFKEIDVAGNSPRYTTTTTSLYRQTDLHDQGASWTRDPWVPPHPQRDGRNADSDGWDRDSPSPMSIHTTAYYISQYPVIQASALSASVQRRWLSRSAVWGGVSRM